MHIHPVTLLIGALTLSGLGHALPSPVDEVAQAYHGQDHHLWHCSPGTHYWPWCISWKPQPTSSVDPAPPPTQTVDPVEPTTATDPTPTPTEAVGPTLTAYPSQPASGLNSTSAFGNIHHKYINQPSGTLKLSPCTIGKGIAFKLALDWTIATVKDGGVGIGPSRDVPGAQWLVQSGKGILEGTVAFRNNLTQKYLRRVPTAPEGKTSTNITIPQYTVDAEGESVDASSVWTCENMQFIGSIDASSTSYFTWIIGGGKGQFLGRPALNATTLESTYSLIQTSSDIEDGNMTDGRIVFSDLVEVFDTNA